MSKKIIEEFFDKQRSRIPDGDVQEAFRSIAELKLDDEQLGALALIAARLDTSKAEALARAIGFYKQLCNHIYEGGSVEFVDAEGVHKKLKLQVKRQKGSK